MRWLLRNLSHVGKKVKGKEWSRSFGYCVASRPDLVNVVLGVGVRWVSDALNQYISMVLKE